MVRLSHHSALAENIGSDFCIQWNYFGNELRHATRPNHIVEDDLRLRL